MINIFFTYCLLTYCKAKVVKKFIFSVLQNFLLHISL